MKDFCGIRTGENNLCRRSELMGQYGRAALSVAPTPQTFSYRKRIRKGKLPPSALRLPPPSKREAMPNAQRLCQVPQGIVKFCRSFFPKAGFLPSFFTQKSGLTHTNKNHIQSTRSDFLHKKSNITPHSINGPSRTPVPTLHKKAE